jgi:DNA-binding NarL/FixJ family response regulator
MPPVIGEVSSGASALTRRELQTFKLLVNGNSNKEAAVALNLSVRTVETYRAKIMLKLNVHSASELLRFAVRNKMIDITPR